MTYIGSTSYPNHANKTENNICKELLNKTTGTLNNYSTEIRNMTQESFKGSREVWNETSQFYSEEIDMFNLTINILDEVKENFFVIVHYERDLSEKIRSNILDPCVLG